MNGNDIFRTIEMKNVAKSSFSNQFFLQFNLRFPSSFTSKFESVIGFSNSALFHCFGGNQKVFINETFKIVPKLFYQCLIVMVFNNQTDVYIPMFLYLADLHDQKIYGHALRLMNKTAGSKMNPTSVTCDFEKGLHNAILKAFHKAIINKSLFHWKQVI